MFICIMLIVTYTSQLHRIITMMSKHKYKMATHPLSTVKSREK